MMYSKFTDSDVCMFKLDEKRIECCGCFMNKSNDSVFLHSTQEAVEHLEKHKSRGHSFSANALSLLETSVKGF